MPPDGDNSTALPQNSGTGRTNRTGPYDANFGLKLSDLGIFGCDCEYSDPDMTYPEPQNWVEMKTRLQRERDPLSPDEFSDASHARFRMRQEAATSKNRVMEEFLLVVGPGPDAMRGGSGLKWDNLAPFAKDGIDLLTTPSPKWYEGAPHQRLNAQIRKELSKFIMPNEGLGLILPNFIVEGMGSCESQARVERTARHRGAIGARAMHKLRLYPAHNGNSCDHQAYVIVVTYQAMALQFFAVHPTPASAATENRDLDYHMGLLGYFGLRESLERYKAGINALRNAQEWASEQRIELIRRANDVRRGTQPGLMPTPGTSHRNTTSPSGHGEPRASEQNIDSSPRDNEAGPSGHNSDLPSRDDEASPSIPNPNLPSRDDEAEPSGPTLELPLRDDAGTDQPETRGDSALTSEMARPSTSAAADTSPPPTRAMGHSRRKSRRMATVSVRRQAIEQANPHVRIQETS
ncbi:MAG: hypothetical protein M1823_002770 [Watsoniomyces obsoletus]|nr:MAG: hypothetical protein M1823_002770 [Watsoniomyces obsoletus]